ncbi:MAG TPA: AAA family ATPase [Candidatus Dormibacteraeota bacterium]|nr:AAA family ATPase [Candidatus Dormibacteraeota bacterium]
MYIIAVIAEKGGVGKTTVALNLAVAAVRSGRTVAVLDIDPQATASKWTDRREDEHPWVVPTHAARIGATINQAKGQGVDFIVIDTPPHSGMDAAEAARRADLVLVPVEPHLFTLETLPKLADLLKLAGNAPALFLVSKAATQGSEGAHAAEHIKAQGFSVCPVILHLRAAHRHATNIGHVAAEYEPDSKAAQEVLQLYTYTIQFIDSARKSHAKAEPAHARA